MLNGPAFLAGLGLLLKGAGAAPKAFPLEPGLISILEDIHVHTPITWHEVTNSDESKSNVTDINNESWDDAVARLAPHPTAIAKRQDKTCFGSGSWAKQAVLKDGLTAACLMLRR